MLKASGGIAHRHLTLSDIRAETHGQTHKQPKPYLSYNLELTLHPILVVTLDLKVVIQESYGSAPHCGYKHQHHIYIG